MEIGSANGACLYAHADFARMGYGIWPLFEDQRLSGRAKNHGFHDS